MKHGTRADKREHLRRHRPREVSVSQGCKLMGLSRSTFYGMPSAALKAGELLAQIAAQEARQGHGKLAQEPRDLIDAAINGG